MLTSSEDCAAEHRIGESADSLSVMLWCARSDGGVDYVDQRWCQYTGWQAERLLGSGWLQVAHPDDRASAESAWRAALAVAQPYEHEMRLRDGAGTYRVFKVRAEPVSLSGSASAWIGLAVEHHSLPQAVPVTQQAPERALAAEERYRLATHAVDGLLYDWDVPCGSMHYSLGLRRLLGVSSEEIPTSSRWWQSRIHPDDGAYVDRMMLAGSSASESWFELQYRLRHGDGHWLTVQDHCVVQRSADGLLRRVFGHVIDVTARLQLERRLRAEATRFRLITETIPQLVWSAPAGGSPDYYNRRFLGYLGLSLVEALTLGWEGILHPDDLSAARAGWRRSLALGEDFTAQFRIRHGRNGPYRWHEALAAALRDSDGKVLRWFGTCSQIGRAPAAEGLQED